MQTSHGSRRITWPFSGRIEPAAHLLLLGGPEDGEETDSHRHIVGNRKAPEQARRGRILRRNHVLRVERDSL